MNSPNPHTKPTATGTEFEAAALRRGREAAEKAAEKFAAARPELEGAARAAFIATFVASYAEEFTRNFVKGALDERARIAGIYQLTEAESRSAEALEIALNTALEPVEAAMVLAAGDGAELYVFDTNQDRQTLVQRMRLSSSLGGRA